MHKLYCNNNIYEVSNFIAKGGVKLIDFKKMRTNKFNFYEKIQYHSVYWIPAKVNCKVQLSSSNLLMTFLPKQKNEQSLTTIFHNQRIKPDATKAIWLAL